MPRNRGQIAVKVAARYLSRAFASGETIAILLRRDYPAATVQRIVALERALQPRYLGWLTHENAAGANVYVAANPVVFGSRKRTKESIAEIRHLYLDLDTDAESKLTALRSSDSVPTPTAIVSTSTGKYQVLWRVEGYTFEQQERVLKLLAITFRGDPACTDCNRVLRLPGFLNQKYDPAHPVSVEYLNDSPSNPADFRLAIRDPEATLFSKPNLPSKGKRKAHEFRAGLGMDSARIVLRKGCGRAHASFGRTPPGQAEPSLLCAANSRCCIGSPVACRRRSDGRRHYDAAGSPAL
jgi:hypothetical protein